MPRSAKPAFALISGRRYNRLLEPPKIFAEIDRPYEGVRNGQMFLIVGLVRRFAFSYASLDYGGAGFIGRYIVEHFHDRAAVS
jgi:hypothetical protein